MEKKNVDFMSYFGIEGIGIKKNSIKKKHMYKRKKRHILFSTIKI